MALRRWRPRVVPGRRASFKVARDDFSGVLALHYACLTHALEGRSGTCRLMAVRGVLASS